MELDQLSAFVGSEARARLLAHFVARPESRLHVRALERDTGIGKRSLQKELARLVEMGLVRREHEGRRVVYARAGYTPQWRAIEKLVATYGIPLLLRAGLAGVPGVQAAFIFGSLARGDARSDSDIDLLVYGEAIPDGAVSSALAGVYFLLARSVDLKLFDRDDFVRWNDPRVSFLPEALAGPKLWLVGSEFALPRGRRRLAA
jgi:predicted nucleotidyltransferase